MVGNSQNNFPGQNVQIGPGFVRPEVSPPEVIPQVYNQGKPNLFIGGIQQKGPDPNQNDQAYRTFADQNQAIYVPTYYSGDLIKDGVEVDNAAQSIRTYENGLKDAALNDQKYGTIFAYSGGTTSVVTAMAEQNVKADTLILISPMRGGLGQGASLAASSDLKSNFDWQGEFAKNIQKILASGTKIIVIQSPDDNPPLGSDYQYKFPTDTSSAITVYSVNLAKRGLTPIDQGVNAHLDIFFVYAKNHIRNGVVTPDKPLVVTPAKPLKAFLTKNALTSLGLASPLLSPPSSDMSNWADVPETIGIPGIPIRGVPDDWDSGDIPFTEDE